LKESPTDWELDDDVLEWFRAQGEGYQIRISKSRFAVTFLLVQSE